MANDKLFMVYNYKNLQIFDCGIENVHCDIIQGQYSHNPGSLRGGSPMIRIFDTNFFLSFAFTHLDYKLAKCTSYRPSLTIIKATNEKADRFEHIYSSEPADFDNLLFFEPISDIQFINGRCEQANILIVTSIARWYQETDEVDIIVSVNDKYDVIARVTGLIDYVTKIIDSHENQKIKHKESCAHELAINYYT